MSFFTTHLGDCSEDFQSKRPAAMPCAYCEASAFLRQKLSSADQTQLNLLLRRETGPNESQTLPDDASIEKLELPIRAHNALWNAGLQTIGALRQRSEWALVHIPRFGRGSVVLLKKILKPHKVKLAAGASLL